MSLKRIHVFESRSAAFQQDSVLQENVIVHAVKDCHARESVCISTSSGMPRATIKSRQCDFKTVVSPEDPYAFIHVVPQSSEDSLRKRISKLPATLSEIGMSVSTGRVVDFRAAEFLRRKRGPNIVPLIRPCHFDRGLIRWPSAKEKKPCAIVDGDATLSLLVPRGHYVLVKRFSAKEERRRIVASTYDPAQIDFDRVGFENHLNYFHIEGGGIDHGLALGLTAFLNSSIVDSYFRHFSGHTQVNATDLRSLRYPTRKELKSIGLKIDSSKLSQQRLDEIVHKEVF